MSDGKNILLVGVGGQGILLASEIISQAAMMQGFDVKKSEVHGMAQRGGIVSSHVRYAERVYSPIIRKHAADVILSFEKAEAQRWLEYLAPEGQIITATTEIVPPAVYVAGLQYPHNVIETMRAENLKVLAVDADAAARKLGNIRAMNVVLLGVLSTKLDFDEETWKEAIKTRVPQKHLELNLRAFDEGRRLGTAASS